MSDVLKVAKKVVEELSDYNAILAFYPEFELRELEDMKIVVIPVGSQYKTLSRNTCEEKLYVQIGILKRCSENEITKLLSFVESIGLKFLNKKFDDAMCVCITYNPIYSSEHLRERSQFTSVIELVFKIFST